MGLLKSILKNTCPRCRRGDLFYRPFTLKNAYKMPSHCSVCNQRYAPEPGFYFGAMFLSYIASAIILVAGALFMVFALRWDVNMSLVIIFVIGGLTHNFFYRLGRSLWIHLMVRYDRRYASKMEASSTEKSQ